MTIFEEKRTPNEEVISSLKQLVGYRVAAANIESGFNCFSIVFSDGMIQCNGYPGKYVDNQRGIDIGGELIDDVITECGVDTNGSEWLDVTIKTSAGDMCFTWGGSVGVRENWFSGL